MAFGENNTGTLLAESREVLFFDHSLEYIEVQWLGDTAQRLLFYSEEGAPPDIAERVIDE